MRFAVVSVSAISEHLQGYLSRFLSEVDQGLYVGNLSPKVAENLWERISGVIDTGSATMVLSDSTQEQGFTILTVGDLARDTMDIDGVTVMSGLEGRALRKLSRRR